mgnify:CR=1 FL=1
MPGDRRLQGFLFDTSAQEVKRKMNMLARICVLLLGLVLSACGGGGGDAGTQALGGSTQALFTSAPASVSVDVGRAAEFTVSGGKAPYAVSSSDLSIVSTGLQGNSTFLINGVKGGAATVTVKDSLGAAVSIAVTVGPGTPLFTTAPTQLTVAVGATESFNIGGGTGPFSVSSANSATATVQLSTAGSSFTVTGQRSGTTSVVVTDAKGAIVTIGVSVGTGQGSVPLFTSAASPVVIGVGTTPVYTIGGGTGPYQATSSNESIAKAAVAGTSVAISGLAAGSASVQVIDAVGARVSIAVTVGTAEVVALYTTAPPGLSLVRGTSQSFAIGGGVGPYTASSGNAAVVSATVTGSSVALAGLGVGTTTVAVFDSQGRSTPIAVTVGAAAPLSTTAPSSLTLAPGTTGSYQVAGGVSPYQVVSSNSAVGSITQNGATFNLLGAAAGVAQVTVRDSAGGQLQIALTVASTQPLFVAAPEAVSLPVGTSSSYAVGAGAGAYTVSSSNTSVVAASLSGTSLTLSALTTGTATVVVRDAAGATQSLTVTAGPAVALFTTAPAAITVAPSSTQSYSVGGGVAPYTATSSNTAVAIATVAGGALTVNGVTSGSATVSLRDSLGVAIPISVTVSTTGIQALTISPAAASGTVGDSLTVAMYGGDPAYTVTPTNSLVAALASQGGNRFVLNLLRSGVTSVVVADSKGQVQSMTVTVVPAPVRALSLSISSPVSLTIGALRTVVVSGGVAPYTVGSSNEAVARASIADGVLTLTPIANGTAVIQVVDSAGTSLQLSATVGANVPLFTTAPASLSLTPGTSQTFNIAGGTSPYFVSTSSNSVASTSVVGSLLTVTGVVPGSANVSVRDSLGASVAIAVSVGSQAPLYTSAPQNVVMSTGTGRSFLVGGGSPEFLGGIPVYSATSSDTSIVTVAASGASILVSALASGSATVNVRDAIGGLTSFLVTVGGSTALYTTAPTAITLAPGMGNSQTYEVRGGAAPYVVTSGNVNVATVTQPSALNTFAVSGVATGLTNVVVTDRLGATVSIGVSVAQAASTPMTVSPLAAAGVVGDVLSFEIRGGSPVYTATVNNPRVATASPFGSASAFTVALNAAGTTNISVIDANGQVQNISVTSASGGTTPLFTSAPPTVVLAVGAPKTYEVGGGSGVYRYQSSNPAVASVASVSSTSYSVTPLAAGVASIQVSDSVGSRFSFDVNVGQVQPLVLSSGPSVTLSPTAGATSYEIVGGRAPYRAVSSNSAVLSVVSPVVGSTLSVTPVAAGTSSLVVTDAAGSQATAAVTVVAFGPANMQVSPATAGASVGDQLALVVKGGTPPYAFSVSNPAVAVLTNQVAAASGTAPAVFSINQSASTIQTFDANGNVVSVPGVVAITVTDAGGQVQTSSVTVTQASTVLRMSPSSVLLSERASLGVLNTTPTTGNLKLYVYGGTGPYVAYSTDTARAGVSVLGDVVYVFSGTNGNLCGPPAYQVTVPLSSAPVNAFDLAVTVVDSKGASAVTKITVVDEAVCP